MLVKKQKNDILVNQNYPRFARQHRFCTTYGETSAVSMLKSKSTNDTLQRLFLALLNFIVAVLWTDSFTCLCLPSSTSMFSPVIYKDIILPQKKGGGHYSPKNTVSRPKTLRSPATPKWQRGTSENQRLSGQQVTAHDGRTAALCEGSFTRRRWSPPSSSFLRKNGWCNWRRIETGLTFDSLPLLHYPP